MAQRYQISDTGIEDIDYELKQLRKASRGEDAHAMLASVKVLRKMLDRVQDDTEKHLWRTEPTHLFDYYSRSTRRDESFTFHGTDAQAKKLARQMTDRGYHDNVVVHKVKDAVKGARLV